MTFAIITPGLIVGAFVERIKFSAVLLFSGLWLLVVYCPVCYWVWGGGWLSGKAIDFAGGIVVHATAGASALTLAWMLGRRQGYPKSLKPPHSPGMVMTGAAMLWVGWFGFNAESAAAADSGAGMAMLVTHISAATASGSGCSLNGRKRASRAWSELSQVRSPDWRPLPGIRIGRADGSHCHRGVRQGDMLFCLRFRKGETWCRRLLGRCRRSRRRGHTRDAHGRIPRCRGNAWRIRIKREGNIGRRN